MLPPSKKKPYIDQTILDCLKQEVGDNSFTMLITTFVEEIDEHIEIIDHHFPLKNYDMVALKVHALKSAAYSFGAIQLGDICREVENIIKNNQTGQLDHPIQQLYKISTVTRAYYEPLYHPL